MKNKILILKVIIFYNLLDIELKKEISFINIRKIKLLLSYLFNKNIYFRTN